MGPAFDLPVWLEDLGAEDLGATPREHGELRLPSGSIVACDPVMFLDGAEPFQRTIAPGAYPVELGVTEEGTVAYALVRFSDTPIVSWEVGLFANRDAPRLGLPVYPADSGVGCFLDAEVAKSLALKGQEHFENGAKWVDAQKVDAEDDEAWHEAFEKYEKENPPPLSDLSAGDVVEVEEVDGNLISFQTGRGDGTYPSFWGMSEDEEPVCLLTDFKVLGIEEEDEDLGGFDDIDEDHGALDALLKLVAGPAPEPEPEPEPDSPFVILASQTLSAWEQKGTIELEEDASRATFVDAFADFLASEPTPAKLEEWLFDQDAIAEVYADSDSLWQSLRDQAREAEGATRRRA
jgi:hypothetical protein